MNDTSTGQASGDRWSTLYKIGGIAALLAVFVFRRNLGAELSLLAMLGIVDGVPTTPHVTAIDWFRLFQDNRLVGLTFLNFFDLFEYALLGLVFLALDAALRHTKPSAMIIATTSGLIGITVYFASNRRYPCSPLANAMQRRPQTRSDPRIWQRERHC